MTIQAILFDVDGTLVDTNRAHVQAWREAFMRHGYDIPESRIEPEIGKGGDQLVPTVLGEDNEKRSGEALRKEHGDAFTRIAKALNFSVFPGVKELFAEVHARGLKCAIATSAKKEFVELIQSRAGFDFCSLADEVVTADEAAQSKPAPDLVIVAMKKLGMRNTQCLFVGDTVHDVEAARRSGVACLGVTCGGLFSRETLLAAGARSVWRDPADILSHLDQVLDVHS